MLIILSGPSGVGKGTVREELFKDDSLNQENHVQMKEMELIIFLLKKKNLKVKLKKESY